MNIISFEELKTYKSASLIVKCCKGESNSGNYMKQIPVEEYLKFNVVKIEDKNSMRKLAVEECLDFNVIKVEDSEIYIEFNKTTIFSRDCVINKNGNIAYICRGEKSYWHINKPKWILLFTGKFDIDSIPNLNTQSKLFTYIYFNDYDRFVEEVNNGANIDEENGEGLTPFGLSLYKTDIRIAEYLFKNVNMKIEYLRIALMMQNGKMFKMILEKIDISETDLDDIFFSCLRYDHEYYKDVISKAHNLGYKHLLENPTIINYVINIHLHKYPDMKFLKRLESLLQHGMKVNDLTILMKTNSCTNDSAIKLILKHQACDINKAIDTNGNTNLHVAYELLMDGFEHLQKTIKLLQENKANPYESNNDGIKPIHYSKENKECTICFKHVFENDVKKTHGCNHYFHLKCLYKWAKENKICPLCGTKLVRTL